VQVKDITSKEPRAPPTVAPVGLSEQGKAAWNERNRFEGEIVALEETTKSFSAEDRSKIYTRWSQANLPILQELQYKIKSVLEGSDSRQAE
jgi:hypothetical protein